MYHIVFASDEEIVIAPLQKDRYPAYNPIVEAEPEICYLFRDDQTGKRQHVAFVRALEQNSIRYRHETVGPYNVLLDFSPREAITPILIASVRTQKTARIEMEEVIDWLKESE
jgi:hypothetical protein